jgi:hypothetical protein
VEDNEGETTTAQGSTDGIGIAYLPVMPKASRAELDKSFQ